MPRVALNGVELYYEDTGHGDPVVFCHEFAADYRGWDPQVRAFGRMYRCITYSYRGFPPSSVPENPAAYSEDHLIEDLRALVAHLGLATAHFIGFSMGGSVVLNFALRYPDLCRTIVVVGAGAGGTNRERFERDIERTVDLLRTRGIADFAEMYAEGPTRLPLKRKDPHGWAVFRRQLADHSATGQALTMLGVQRQRPTIFSLESVLPTLAVPTLVVIGDEDEPCVDTAVF
ncbi:MAG: alpha/beta hydrolase, partial [Chloroflexi bacterium]|nr:alpha/beta hydrolase [Chloroflexota bacterium]